MSGTNKLHQVQPDHRRPPRTYTAPNHTRTRIRIRTRTPDASHHHNKLLLLELHGEIMRLPIWLVQPPRAAAPREIDLILRTHLIRGLSPPEVHIGVLRDLVTRVTVQTCPT